MSTMVAELYDDLRKAGVDEQLAQGAARAVLGADARMDLATKSDLLVLKGDITALRADLSGDMAKLRADLASDSAKLRADVAADMAVLRTDMTELRADMAELRADTARDLSGMHREISEMKVELIKWNVGAMAVLTAIFAAIVRLG
jgi:uncharacterized protein involved in exopolysaccharide biosynthesis